MIVSLLRESRPGERRVLLLPQDATTLTSLCDLQVEAGAGAGMGIPDDAYTDAGARITRPAQAWEGADLLLKLKAPTTAEVQQIRPGAAIAALFHAEGTPDVVSGLLARNITAYSFEYFQEDDGSFPLMAATGEIAGQMAVIYAAYHLQSHLDGSGISLPACAHAPAARVAVIGYGNAGRAAAGAALALGAQVTVYTWQQSTSSGPRAGTRPEILPLGVHRTAAAQISRHYTPAIRRLIASLDGTAGYPAGQRGLITAAGQIVNEQVRRHYDAGFTG